jgi:hypothetical protein
MQVIVSLAMPSTARASSTSASVGSTLGMIAWTKLLVIDEVRLVIFSGFRNFKVSTTTLEESACSHECSRERLAARVIASATSGDR